MIGPPPRLKEAQFDLARLLPNRGARHERDRMPALRQSTRNRKSIAFLAAQRVESLDSNSDFQDGPSIMCSIHNGAHGAAATSARSETFAFSIRCTASPISPSTVIELAIAAA